MVGTTIEEEISEIETLEADEQYSECKYHHYSSELSCLFGL